MMFLFLTSDVLGTVTH